MNWYCRSSKNWILSNKIHLIVPKTPKRGCHFKKGDNKLGEEGVSLLTIYTIEQCKNVTVR